MDGAKNSHLVYLDADFNFIRVNEAYATTCGYRPEDMVGKNHFDLYPHAENEAIFKRVRDTGESFEIHDKPFEFPDQPDRGITYWDWTLTPTKDQFGKIDGFVFSLHETTERKKTEQSLRESEMRARNQAEEMAAMMELTPTAV
jgi:PAS domain S-box-containing protein